MAANRYAFVTRWRVEGTREEVFRVLEDTADLVRWWPSVWLKVEQLRPADANGVNGQYRLTSKGWLPYVLAWTMTTTEKAFPERLALAADGDFRGTGVWTLAQDGAFADVTYDWTVVADKPLLRHLSFLFKPLFRANHNWAMRKGLESLRLELARRRATTGAERGAVPAPPGPTFLGPRKRKKLDLG
ncbi:MAG: SRPBCC family protein [Planctomycetes bacterium]|nr:SRPBCC family protein [Planctomycetota bacterium]